FNREIDHGHSTVGTVRSDRGRNRQVAYARKGSWWNYRDHRLGNRRGGPRRVHRHTTRMGGHHGLPPWPRVARGRRRGAGTVHLRAADEGSRLTIRRQGSEGEGKA